MTYDISKAFLANKVYETNDLNEGATFDGPNETRWQLVLKDSQPDGYQGALFKNLSTGKYEFASRGTEPLREPVNDLVVADMQMGFKVMPDQMVSQRNFFQKAKDEITKNQGNPTTDLTAVGDSLGGSLVNLLGVENPSLQVTAFNAYGVGNLVPTGTYSNITNNVFARDPVSVLPGSYMIGKTYMYNEPDNPSGNTSTALSSHTMRSLWQNASVVGQAGKAVNIDVPSPLNWQRYVDGVGGIQGDPMTGMPWPTANDVTASGNGYNFPNVAGGGGTVNPNSVVSATGLGTTRNSASFITDTNANDHMAVIRSGGTLGDLWVAQKNSATGFANEKDFYKAVLTCNPNIADVNHIAAGQTIYLPEKMADGSVTYNFAGGTAINSNATTGEYHMVVQNADGGQTVYSRTVDADAGYLIKQTTTDKTGAVTLDYSGHQNSLNADIKPFELESYTPTVHGQTYTHNEYDNDGNITEVQTAVYDSKKGLTEVEVFRNGTLIGYTTIEGKATQAQLDRALALSEQLANATSFGATGTSDSGESFVDTLNILDAQETAQLEAGVQTLSFADTRYSGTNVASTPVFTTLANYSKWLVGRGTQASLRNGIEADPSLLGLQDGALTLALARQNPNPVNVMRALQSVVLAGGVLSETFKQSVADQLGTNTTDVNKWVASGGAAITSFLVAMDKPTVANVTSAAISMLNAGLVFTPSLKQSFADKLGVTSDQFGQMLAYGGAGLAVASVLKNPTPQNIVAATQQVNSLIEKHPEQLGDTLEAVAEGRRNTAAVNVDYFRQVA